jgi:hypothetical protein
VARVGERADDVEAELEAAGRQGRDLIRRDAAAMLAAVHLDQHAQAGHGAG